VQLDLVVETLGVVDGFEFRQLSAWKHFITADAPPVTDSVCIIIVGVIPIQC
jgi:hypothetical protein